jgi:hypothetical protein
MAKAYLELGVWLALKRSHGVVVNHDLRVINN